MEIPKQFKQENAGDFYKSFYDEQKKKEEEIKEETVEEKEEIAAKYLKPESLKPEVEKDKPEVEDENKLKKQKGQTGKSTEERAMEGVGYWSKMCESRGDFETPKDNKADNVTSKDIIDVVTPKENVDEVTSKLNVDDATSQQDIEVAKSPDREAQSTSFNSPQKDVKLLQV